MSKSTVFLMVSIFLYLCGGNTVLAQEEFDYIPQLKNPFSESYVRQNLKKTKPRLVYNEQIVKELSEKIKTDPVMGNMYNAVRYAAYEILDTTIIERIKTTNSMLDISREFLRRVNMLGLVYLMERNDTILDRINEEVLSVCRFSDWNPPVYLDVAEISTAVSLALDWTLDNLPESTIKEAKKALIEKGIYPSWEEYGGNPRHAWWVNHYNNWNQVCNAGMVAASITIAEDDPKLAAKTIKRALNSIPHVMVVNYYPDGVCPEGVGYWNYTTSYALMTNAMLETTFGLDCGYKDYPGFMESADFKLMGSNLPSGWYYNYADCADKPKTDGDILLAWFAAQTGESKYFEKEKFMMPPEKMRMSYLTGAALAWMCRYEEQSTKKPDPVWAGKGKTPVVFFRGEGENKDYYFGAKGGCGAVSHGNLDAGSFIFELKGVRWSVDPGTQNYLIGEQGFDLWRQCQECERWELLTKNNWGHSTLTVNDERHNVDGYALLESYKKGRKPEATLDLSPTFEGQLKSAFRKFTKDTERSLLIEDQIHPDAHTINITWQFVTQADVKIIDGGAVLSQDGEKLKIENLSHPGTTFKIVSLDPPPHRLDKQLNNLKRIELSLPAAYDGESSPVNIRIRLTGDV